MTGRPTQAEFLTTSVLEPLARKWKSTASQEITRWESYCRAVLRMLRHINCQVLLSKLGRKHRVHYFETAMQHKIVKRCEINDIACLRDEVSYYVKRLTDRHNFSPGVTFLYVSLL